MTPAELALRASELSYRRLFEAALDGILILDGDTGRITDANPFLIDLLGYSRDEMVGKTVGELSPFNEVVSNQAMLERLQQDGHVRYEEIPLIMKDQRPIAVELVGNVYDAGNQRVIQCHIRDITHRKQADSAANLLAAIVESSEDAIIGKDLKGLITSWNLGAEKIFGYSAREMVGRSITRLIPEERHAEENAILERLERGQSIQQFETRRLTRDGRLIDVSVTASPIKDADGKTIGVSKALRDISDRKRGERALRQSEAEFRALAETMPHIVWATGTDGENIYFNRRWMDYTGLTLAESLGDGWHRSLHPEDGPQTWAAWETAVAGGGDYSVECRLRRADGCYRWWWILGAPFRAEDGGIIKWFGTCTDITERKQAEIALQESQRFLRATLDSLNSEIAILDELGTIIEVNAAWKLFASENKFTGNPGVGNNYLKICDAAVGDESREAHSVAAGIRAVIAGQQDEFHLEYSCHSSVEKQWQVVHVTRFEGEGPLRVVVAHDNITERKLAEQELRWKTALLEAQLEASIDGILAVDNQGEMILQNRRMAELWKIPRHIATQKNEPEQFRHAIAQTKNPEQFAARVNHLNAHPEETSQEEIELVDGTILDRYTAPVLDPAENHYGRIWFFRDITERRKLEQRVFEAQKMESIGQLAGGIAHDFNNILAAITGNLYLATMDAAEQPAILEHLENISAASQRAAELVKQILAFSRKTNPDRAPIQLNPIVMEALKLLRASLPAGIRIETDLAETPAVMANATAIHQVIMNLGTNAWHAMTDQKGVFRVDMKPLEVDEDFARTRPDLHAGNYVQLSVSDTGKGMDRQTLKHIFDPFFTTKGVGEGTGLGLSVVHAIMKSHDGGICAYSEPGIGTRFTLYFPAVATSVAVPAIKATTIAHGHGEHILLVDDEESLAEVGKQMLEHLGYTVTAKTSPLDAVTALREQPEMFDLAITDLTMPGMDGVELGRQLLEIQPRLALILSTGYSRMTTAQKLQELGFRELLIKPWTGRDLAEAVARALHPAA